MADMAWVAVGDQANWEKGFENGIWGIKPELEHHWQRITRNGASRDTGSRQDCSLGLTPPTPGWWVQSVFCWH